MAPCSDLVYGFHFQTIWSDSILILRKFRFSDSVQFRQKNEKKTEGNSGGDNALHQKMASEHSSSKLVNFEYTAYLDQAWSFVHIEEATPDAIKKTRLSEKLNCKLK